MSKSAMTARTEDQLRQTILKTLADRLGAQRFNAWFKSTTNLEIQAKHVKLNVPNPFVASWIESHFRGDLEEVLAECMSEPVELMICVDTELSRQFRRRQLDNQADLVSRSTSGDTRPTRNTRSTRSTRNTHSTSASHGSAGSGSINRTGLEIHGHAADLDNPPLRHKLENFVVGDSNRLAYQAALAAAAGKSDQYSPLFLHGGSGLGKTHMLQGICNAAVTRNGRPARWRYVSGEQFTNEFISALKARKIEQFRKRYRNLDLLAIDDVHFLAAKQATQEEFLHTFNAIDGCGRQVVMASDTHPKFLGQLSEQLTSRFLSGMVVKVDHPDRKTRMKILTRKAATLSVTVPRDVLDYIAMHITGNVRELEGTLVKLAALANLENTPITRDMATEALSDHLARTAPALTLGDIENKVSAYFCVTPADLRSSRRTRTISLARMTVMTLARRNTQMSYPEIARSMGKNHSSVILAVKKMEKLVTENGHCKWSSPAGDKTAPAASLLEILGE